MRLQSYLYLLTYVSFISAQDDNPTGHEIGLQSVQDDNPTGHEISFKGSVTATAVVTDSNGGYPGSNYGVKNTFEFIYLLATVLVL